MPSNEPIPGLSGVVAIIVASIVVSAMITVVTGQLLHWVALALAVLVGVWAVQAINK